MMEILSRIGAWYQLGNQGVAGFMISNGFLFPRTHDPTLFLQARDNPLNRPIEIRRLNRIPSLSCRK
jgi:hypothetical protein